MSRKVIKHVLIRNEKLNIENYEKNSLEISNNRGETYMSSQIQAKEELIVLILSILIICKQILQIMMKKK